MLAVTSILVDDSPLSRTPVISCRRILFMCSCVRTPKFWRQMETLNVGDGGMSSPRRDMVRTWSVNWGKEKHGKTGDGKSGDEKRMRKHGTVHDCKRVSCPHTNRITAD